MSKPSSGEFYASFDEPSGAWCVFHTDGTSQHDGSYAYSSFADEAEARADADSRNS